MGQKHWLLLPFLGSSEGHREHRHYAARQKETFSGNETFLTTHESAADFAAKSEEDIINDYNAPTRWWIVSTLFPLLAGTFGPLASAFNIIAVAIHWRLMVDPSSTESQGKYIPDPTWLVAANAVSLGIGIVANFFLLGHMTNRLPFKISAPAVIFGWYISGFINVALVAAAPTFMPLPPSSMAAYSQAYYYAAFSAVLYVLLSAMLTVTAGGILIGHFSATFKLTLAQRSLMVQTMFFLAYLLLSGAVYSAIEGWDFPDAVYFSVVTLFTIGFGDFVPTTHLGRSIFFPWVICGIVIVGLIIGNIRTLVLDSIAVKMSTRMIEQTRYKAITAGDPRAGFIKIRGVSRRDIQGPNEFERRRKEFEAMREIRRVAAQNGRAFTLFCSVLALGILWFIGAVCFWQGEKAVGGDRWSYFESVYFTFVAELTIGYGDFAPQTNSAKPTFVFWALIALPTLTVLLGSVGDAVSDFSTWVAVTYGKHTPRIFQVLSCTKDSGDSEDPSKETSQSTDDTRSGFEETMSGIKGAGIGTMAHVGGSKACPGHCVGLLDVQALFKTAQAAQNVLQHVLEQMDNDSMRQYTFEEWASMLQLLGEDEASEEGHRRVGMPAPAGTQIAEPYRQHENQVWTWMGQESPLMNLVDNNEPRWILSRLLNVLAEKLRQAADESTQEETKDTALAQH